MVECNTGNEYVPLMGSDSRSGAEAIAEFMRLGAPKGAGVRIVREKYGRKNRLRNARKRARAKRNAAYAEHRNWERSLNAAFRCG